MIKKDLSEKIFLSLTGETEDDWRSKIDEINSLGLDTVALFLECYPRSDRNLIYEALEKSCIKNIPLIHIRNGMEKNELKYLCEKYNNPYLTIHESSFQYLEEWNGFHRNLFMEMNFDDHIPNDVDVDKIGGFCIDFSHFKSAQEKWSKEFEYIIERRNKKNLFKCNHLNGYSYEKNKDIHTVSDLKEFEYLKTLPEFVFGDVIAIEVFNSISDQINYKKYITRLFQGEY